MSVLSLAFGLPGTPELIVIGLIALLIFGRRLPDVARSLGNSIVQFKKGINDVQDEVEGATTSTPVRNPLDVADPANKVKPLEPFDERLGGDREELERIQREGGNGGSAAAAE